MKRRKQKNEHVRWVKAYHTKYIRRVRDEHDRCIRWVTLQALWEASWGVGGMHPYER